MTYILNISTSCYIQKLFSNSQDGNNFLQGEFNNKLNLEMEKRDNFSLSVYLFGPYIYIANHICVIIFTSVPNLHSKYIAGLTECLNYTWYSWNTEYSYDLKFWVFQMELPSCVSLIILRLNVLKLPLLENNVVFQ